MTNFTIATLLLVGIAAGLESCATPVGSIDSNGHETIKRGAFSGTRKLVDFLYEVNPDCSSPGLPTVNVKEAPAHGTVVIENGSEFTRFPEDSKYYDCNLSPHPAVIVSYTSQVDFIGEDRFVLDTVFPDGQPRVTTVDVTVEARETNPAATPASAVATHDVTIEAGGTNRAATPTNAVATQQDEMITLLINGNFDELNRRLMEIQHDFEAGKLTDVDLLKNYRRFHAKLSPEAVAKLDEWVAYSPDSYIAHLARGEYLKNKGLDIRGVKYVSQTPPENLEGAKEYYAQAKVELEKSLPLTSKPYFSVYELLDLSMHNKNNREEALNYLERANQMAPDNSLVRDRYMVSLTPRWGGSYKDEDAFILRCIEEGVPSNVITQLKAIALNDLGDTLLGNHHKPQDYRPLLVEALKLGAQSGSYFSKDWIATSWRNICFPSTVPSPVQDYCN
ncbi:MAG: tetratricopeptide repeat protein [Stenotrophobium sp.]